MAEIKACLTLVQAMAESLRGFYGPSLASIVVEMATALFESPDRVRKLLTAGQEAPAPSSGIVEATSVVILFVLLRPTLARRG